MNWDVGAVYTSNQELGPSVTNQVFSVGNPVSASEAQKRFRGFIRTFRVKNQFVYREKLLQNFRRKLYFLEISLRDLSSYDPELQDAVQKEPCKFISLFELALRQVVSDLTLASLSEISVPQLLLKSTQKSVNMRELNASDVNGLLQISGIVISSGRACAKAELVALRCRSCRSIIRRKCTGPFQGVNVPRHCQMQSRHDDGDVQQLSGDKSCGVDPYVILPDESAYIDQQTLKLQEAPEQVPTGEMPRHILLAADRYLVDTVSPGTRVSIIGVYSIFKKGSQKKSKGDQSVGQSVRTPYFKVLGINITAEGSGRAATLFSPEDEQYFKGLAKSTMIYENIWKSICPSISGDYTVDIKKAIACLLFGGSRKILPDGMALRGDINILLLGDPSTAKSQFLKFVEKVAPVGVYTSGKGSSAAGLTASVIRDAKGEFYLEGGAMVLSDGGVCCIDEFDKMRESDRVAIHEAMEQQTISVAKAGITTILNSRSSVLAAANPVYGSYDDSKSAAENIDFLPTILSRFDLIFIVRDIRDENKDREIAQHVMGIHINSSSTVFPTIDSRNESQTNDLTIQMMKRFISFCRMKCAPSLSADAADILQSHYIKIRDQQRRQNISNGALSNSVPITVRQLEAIIRLSEALAKMSLTMSVTVSHMLEAIRLFKVSTGIATSFNSNAGVGHFLPETREQIQTIENLIKRRISVGGDVPVLALVNEFVNRGFANLTVRKALQVLILRGDLHEYHMRKVVRRLR
jgi:DNA replication licensing factor MCM5